MKNTINILLSFLYFISGYSQDMTYEVQRLTTQSVNINKLYDAQTMSDINSGYPSSWVKDYISAEILATSNGKIMKATGSNETLSTDQKNMLKSADLNTDVVVDVFYRYKNAATDSIVIHQMHFSLTVVPDIEAEYPGGDHQMAQYLKEKVSNKISKKNTTQIQQAIVKFTVNEEGEIVNAKISTTSTDQKTDNLFLKAINKMPKWKPAENANGVKVKQEFTFSLGSGNGC